MVEAMLRRGRRTEAGRLAAAVEYAEMGWPVCPGAVPRDHGSRHLRHSLVTRSSARDTGRACSCDRIGCPAPGAHPVSAAWQIEASTDPDEVARWWRKRPNANIILVTRGPAPGVKPGVCDNRTRRRAPLAVVEHVTTSGGPR